jgi:hypothetical protein
LAEVAVMMKNWTLRALLVLIPVMALGALVGWHYRHSIRAEVWRLELPRTEAAPPGATRFAVFGDYGTGTPTAWHVALMIGSWKPDFVATVGDNFYPEGAATTLDGAIGRFYHQYIAPYHGRYGKGADTNRYFPIPGHRDWDLDSLRSYTAYFDLPGHERYYDVVQGPVHLFMLDTDEREPDGATVESAQAQWLKAALERSQSRWNLVFAHHAPYTSHTVPDVVRMRWPFRAWGADAVLSGYYHVYERLEVDSLPYFVDGTGGAWVSHFGETDPHSRFRYNGDFGAMIIDATSDRLVFRYVTCWGKVLDTLALTAGPKVGQ